jgi:flavin reductase (DIM6/NTAB) family NADH-FMN oxidoreductase RutF
MFKREANKRTCLQPAPKVLVSCRGHDGKNNALAVAYCGNCSFDPPMVMVGIVPSRYSHHMIKETGCFVVNLVPKTMKAIFDYLGSHSGRDEDKLTKIGINLAEAVKVNASILADFPVNIECRVVASVMTGSHEMFIGKVEYVHVDREYCNEQGEIEFSRIDWL